MHKEPIVFQFTPINGTNGNKRAMYAVISLEGELSWIKPATMAVNPNQTNSGDAIKELDFNNILTPDQLTDEVSKLDLGIEPDSRSTSQAVALANMTAGAMKSIGAGTNSNNKPRFAVRAPIEVTGIFNASPDGVIQCRVYRLTDDGAVLHTVDNFTAFSPTRGRGGFPKFARLPAEIRDMIVSFIFQMSSPFPHPKHSSKESRPIHHQICCSNPANLSFSGSTPCHKSEPCACVQPFLMKVDLDGFSSPTRPVSLVSYRPAASLATSQWSLSPRHSSRGMLDTVDW
jgi:hypothetical protein